MCPGLEEWWLYLISKTTDIQYLCMVVLCLGFLADTMFCVKWLAKLNTLVLVIEFVVVAILSEWWSGLTTVGTSLTLLSICELYKFCKLN